MKPRTPKELMGNNLLVKHLAGSHAYGTAIPTSDTDYRGIFCADPINILTPFFTVKETEDNSEEDTKYFELAHFMKLCTDCNPNIIETLWVDDSDILHTSDAYKTLRFHRGKLLTSRIAHTFSGYAMAQMKRIKGHNKWINNPQSEKKPQQKDFISLVQWFGANRVMPSEFDTGSLNHNNFALPYGGSIYGLYAYPNRQIFNVRDGAIKTQYEDERHKLGNPIAVIKFNKEEWRNACDRWEQYWTWKRERNEVRSALEESHGYDTKHAMHLVRLMRMGAEILETGQVFVKRPDAKELLEIRNGKWTYDELIEYAEHMDNLIRNVLYKRTHLRKKPDYVFAANLLMKVQEAVWDDK